MIFDKRNDNKGNTKQAKHGEYIKNNSDKST